MNDKSLRLAASAVSVIVAASIMLLTRRPGLEDISESVPLACWEREQNRIRNEWRTVGTDAKASDHSGVSSRIGCNHPWICRAQNVKTKQPSQAAHRDFSAIFAY